MGDWRRLAAVAIIIGGALLGEPGQWAESAIALARLEPQPPTPPAGSLDWLHVEHPRDRLPFIADPQGRPVVLRGVVAAGLVDYWSGTDPSVQDAPPHWPIDPAAYANGACPPNDITIWIPPLCRGDLAEMRDVGVQVLRLAISWSLLEPQPGRYSATYLQRIRQVVDWASAERIYIILDMHQNAYSRYVGRVDPRHLPLPNGAAPGLNDYDGAPAWATFTDGMPSEKFLGQREVNPAVFEAATSFWLNRDGIQDRYIEAIAELARAYKDNSTVIGYNLFNEPWPGWIPPPAFDDQLLFPAYRRVIDAVTGTRDGLPCPVGWPYAPACGYIDLGIHADHQMYFVEPGLVREVTDFPTHLPTQLTAYPNVVLGLHAYTHIYTLDAIIFHADANNSTWPSFEQSYRWGEFEAGQLGAAMFVSEYGNDPRNDARLLVFQAALQRRYHVGSTFWVWKQNCGSGPWGLYDGVVPASGACAYDSASPDTATKPQNGPLRPERAEIVLGR
jgi:endoglycosylceramidase